MVLSVDVTYKLPCASNAKAVGRYISANLMIENPGGSSVPASSIVIAGIVGIAVGAFVGVGEGGSGVSVKGICVGSGELVATSVRVGSG